MPRSEPTFDATAAVVLAAGQGKRMRSALPKVLHALAGAPLLEWVLDLCAELGLGHVHAVIGHGADAVRAALPDRGVDWVVQTEQRGTGHAVDQARPRWGDVERVLVLYGDVPLLSADAVRALAAAHEAGGGGISLLSAVLPDATGYGRILRDERDAVVAIVEERDATPAQRRIREFNSGIGLFDAALLAELLPQLSTDNEQGELYLTDTIGLAIAAGRPVRAVVVEPEQVLGVNSPADLAAMQRLAQARIQGRWIERGVRISDPSLTYIEHGAELAADVVVHPFSLIRRGARVAAGAEVGPFSHLREGADLAEGSAVGNFVEIKKTRLGKGSKAKHLSYLGDGDIGAGANIGAGTIFANYDGRAKHPTHVGDGAFIGSGTVLVAPVRIGDRAMTGAGAVVTRGHDVPDDGVVVGVPARPLPPRPTTLAEDA